eukprot:TRINITY_DN10725_c0_g1_i1.p1 TRINITY_DN10725_c0_g1~~TRINITY_DN10725_c0_g1_i1.p1  ORF type:complete len:443 (-),score=106.73 TRINITY_DN10725_c0_g1_i1:145-1407(-)
MSSKVIIHEPYGEPMPFCEPSWYQGLASPYYHSGHVEYRNKAREFIESEVKPLVQDLLDEGKHYPLELHEKAYKAGVSGIIYPREFGGNQPEDFDAFYELIMWDEMARATGHILGQNEINSMALPPLIQHGSQYLKDLVLTQVITGKKNCSLAISEPGAGSDVANIATTAVDKGDHFLVNGQKKWITGGVVADFFTVLVRTGGPGMGGLSLLLLEKDMPGIRVRKMKTQFSSTHNTSFVILDDVKVPKRNLVGELNQGFMIIMKNFNHERFVIAIQAARGSRNCYEESIKYALKRKTFGKPLISHQLIRFKLAEMIRQIEALQDNLEKVAYQFSHNTPANRMGGVCALLKVQATKTFEFCAREASQIFGGAAVIRTGQGAIVERLYREVRGSAIPGGSEEILLDFAVRQVAAKAKKLAHL